MSTTHSSIPDSSKIVLHVWPAEWELPSIDPSCIAAVLYLQSAIPGQFYISECTNPDLSPTGQSLLIFIHASHPNERTNERSITIYYPFTSHHCTSTFHTQIYFRPRIGKRHNPQPRHLSKRIRKSTVVRLVRACRI